jgi:hypothetical protein
MPEEDSAPANPSTPNSQPESARPVAEAQGQRALKALIGSGAAEFPMDVQMANMDPAGGMPPPQAPATPNQAPASEAPATEGNP